MTAKELLLELIKKQKKAGIRSGDWDELKPEFEIGVDGDGVNIDFDSVSMGFSFDKNGRFNGIYNWKE